MHNIIQKIFWGVFWGPQNPLFYHFRGFWGSQNTPSKYFLDSFLHLIILFELSAFQGHLTFYFTIILRDFMKLLEKLVKIQEFYIIKFAQISDFQGVPGGRFKNKLEAQKNFGGLMYPPVMGKHRELLQNPILGFSGTP